MGGESPRVVVWPELAAPFDRALRDVTAMVLARVQPVGMVAAGSVLRGEGGPTSDIDLYVIHQASWRQRIQQRYHGVPCEVFINPPAQVRRYFQDEHAGGRPITAHMLATGVLLLNRDPVVTALVAEARTWLERRPDPTPDQLRWQRYMVVDLLDNAQDLLAVDPANARLILDQAVRQTVEHYFWSHGRFLPRQKALLAELARQDPPVGALAQRYYAAGQVDQAWATAAALADHVVGATTFFPWESTPETVQA